MLHIENLKPERSQPAILADHEIKFDGPNGNPQAKPLIGKNIHGVVHFLTKFQIEQVDKIEMVPKTEITVKLYSGETVNCYIYKNLPEGSNEKSSQR